MVTVTVQAASLVGSSSSPVSSMTISALAVTALVFKLMGRDNNEGIVAALGVTVIAWVMAAVAADTSQDLKTGHILGATPWRQRLGEIIGLVCSPLVVGSAIILMDKAWGIGSPEIPAPRPP